MTIMPGWLTAILVIAVLLIVAFVIYKKNKPTYKDVNIPMPAVLRNDLLFGHYSSVDRTYDQIKDHVNLYWTGFHGYDRTVAVLRENIMKVVLAFDGEMIDLNSNPRKRTLLPNAEEKLRNLFQRLQDEGVLQNVKYLYPFDEPNMFMASAEEHLKMLKIVRRVRDEFEELSGSKLVCIYGHSDPFWNIEQYDVVGVDYYKQKSSSLTTGEHARLVKAMLPHQTMLIIPGSGYRHNPEPWIAYAHAEPRVEMFVTFLWFEWEDPKNKDDKFTGLEAQPEEVRELWIDTAFRVRNIERTTPRIPGILPSWLEAKAAWDKANQPKKEEPTNVASS